MSISLLTKINTLLNIILMLMSTLFSDEGNCFVKYYTDVMSICLLTKINHLLNIMIMLFQSVY